MNRLKSMLLSVAVMSAVCSVTIGVTSCNNDPCDKVYCGAKAFCIEGNCICANNAGLTAPKCEDKRLPFYGYYSGYRVNSNNEKEAGWSVKLSEDPESVDMIYVTMIDSSGKQWMDVVTAKINSSNDDVMIETHNIESGFHYNGSGTFTTGRLDFNITFYNTVTSGAFKFTEMVRQR